MSWGYGKFEVIVKCLSCGESTLWETDKGYNYTGQYVTVVTTGGCETCSSTEVQVQCSKCKKESM